MIDWRQHLEEAARKGVDPISTWGSFAELGNTSLQGEDADLVAKYWGLTGGQRNQEWVDANPTEFWQRQLRDAQNWFANEMQHYGNVRADELNKGISASVAGINKDFLNPMLDTANANTEGLLGNYNKAVSELGASQQGSMAGLSGLMSNVGNVNRNLLGKDSGAGAVISEFQNKPVINPTKEKVYLNNDIGKAFSDVLGYDANRTVGISQRAHGTNAPFGMGGIQKGSQLYNSLLSGEYAQRADALKASGDQKGWYNMAHDLLAAQSGETQLAGGLMSKKPYEGGGSDFDPVLEEVSNLQQAIRDLYGSEGVPAGLDVGGAALSQAMKDYRQAKQGRWGLTQVAPMYNPAGREAYGQQARQMGYRMEDAKAKMSGVLSSLRDQYSQTASALRGQRATEASQIKERQLQTQQATSRAAKLNQAAQTQAKPGRMTMRALPLQPQGIYQANPMGITRGYSLLG